MMKKIFGLFISTLIVVLGLSVTNVSAASTDAICDWGTAEQKELAGCNDGTVLDVIPQALMWVFGIVGILAVGLIIFGGVRYSISQGDPGKTKKAKDTIMYAIIGLLVSLLAFSIVSFVLGGINPASTDDSSAQEEQADE